MKGERIRNVSRVCCGFCGRLNALVQNKEISENRRIETATEWICGLTRIYAGEECSAYFVMLSVFLHFYWAGGVGPQSHSSHDSFSAWFTQMRKLRRHNMDDIINDICFDVPQDQGISRAYQGCDFGNWCDPASPLHHLGARCQNH